MAEHEISYSRKTGDTGSTYNKEYKYQISMERFGQILYSLKGNPHKASNKKKEIFDKDYNEIFGEGSLKVDESPAQIKKYFEIKSLYEVKAKTDGYQVSDQKIFYVLYLQANTSKSDDELIVDFEKVIDGYNFDSKDQVSPARKLIQVGFKDFVDKEFSINSIQT